MHCQKVTYGLQNIIKWIGNDLITYIKKDIYIEKAKLLIDSFIKGYDIGIIILAGDNNKKVIDGNKRMTIIYNAFVQQTGIIPFINMTDETIEYHDANYRQKYLWPLYVLISSTKFREYTKQMLGPNYDNYNNISLEDEKILDRIDVLCCTLLDNQIITVSLPNTATTAEIQEIKKRLNIKL